MIKLQRLTNDIDQEIDRISEGPTLANMLAFEAVLTRQYAATQGAVHIQTGSLKSSGQVSSNISSDNWEGNISYGGPSTGIYNPVDYAEFERERDGAHDFLAPAVRLSSQYIQAMNEFLGG